MSARRPRDDRGGVALLTGLMVVVLVGVASLAVDIGMQRVVRADMQALADVVALDAARLLDGRPAGEIRSGTDGQPALDAVVAASVARNQSALGDAPTVTAELVSTTLDAHGALVPVRDAAGAVVPVAGSEQPDAVWIEARGAVDFAFRSGSGSAVRTALANATPSACFRLGSWAAAVDASSSSDTESAQLDEMLNAELSTTALGYHGLADSSVSLAGIAADLGAGSAGELAALDNVKLRNLFAAAARVLAADSGNAADVALLQNLAAHASSKLDATIDLGELVVAGTETAVLSGDINVLDLVASAVYLVDGDHFVAMQSLWTVPKFSQGDQEMTIVERPRTACGPPGPDTYAETAQLRLESNPKLAVSSLPLAQGEPTVSLSVFLAGGRGTLAAVDCGEASATDPESMDVTVSRELSHVDLQVTIPMSGDMKLSDLGLLDASDLLALFGVSVLPGANAKATVSLTVDAGASVTPTDFGGTASYAVPPHTYAEAEVVGDAAPALIPSVSIETSDISGTITYAGRTYDLHSAEMSSRVDLTTLISDITTKLVTPAINDFVAKANAELAPVAALLGLRLNGVDLFGLRRPRCDNPALRG